MVKVKAVGLIALLVIALTGAVLVMSQDAMQLPAQSLEMENSRVQDILREKLVNAEESLTGQADLLANDAQLVEELSAVRDKLLSATPSELKQQSRNTWNTRVFSRLVDWREKRGAEIVQQKTAANDILRAASGNMTEQAPLNNWWGKAPDLVLAFASVPMKTGELSATLIANGAKGKELTGGKRYDEEVSALREVMQNQKPIFGHFAWDGKMYMAVVSPVAKDGSLIGSVVIGVEVARDGLAAFESAVPDFVRLMVVYASPRFGQEGRRVIYASSDRAKSALETNKYRINANAQKVLSFDEIPANSVYTSDGDEEYAVSRLPWVWNENEESDFYIMADLNGANMRSKAFQRNILVAGIITFLVGIILMIIFVGSLQRQTLRIRKGIAEAIASGDPISGDILAALMGEDADELGQYTIQRVDAPVDEASESWTNMMMDFDDEAAATSDRAITKEEMDNIKNEADIKEATELYEKYMKLRKENGIDSPMDFDCFLRRLKRNVDKIKQTYHCDTVHFEVHVSDGNVLLKPKIERKS